MNPYKRVFSLFMALVLLFSSTVFVSATEAQSAGAAAAEETIAQETTAEEAVAENASAAEGQDSSVVRVSEVVSLRQTNSETYLLSDGTYECVVYAEDKYFRNEANALQPIDNTVAAVSSTAGIQTTDSRYKNAANAFDVYFSSSGTPEISIGYQDASLTFSPLSATTQGNAHMSATASAIAVGRVDNCDALAQLTATGDNTVTYAGAFSNTDLVYVLENNAVKEYIILKNASAPNSFSFLFTPEGAAFTEADGTGHFVDSEGNALFSLASLFAMDANGKPTDALTYTFEPVPKLGGVVVTVTLDEEYLSDPDRAFPVVIDPTVTISSSQTADTCISLLYPDTNYYLSTYLRTGKDTDFGLRRSFLRFEIPSTVPAYSVTGAALRLEKVAGATPTIRAYRCTQSWASSTLTWNNMPLLTAANCSPLATLYSGNWYSMDVTQIVQLWVNGTYPNYGFTVKDDTEADENHWTTLYSSDADSPHKPELHITYTDTTVTPTVSLNHSSITVQEGRSMTLAAAVTPSGVAVTWSTSNSAVATVSSSGIVTAVKAGTATITASVPGGSASCTVYVTLADGFYYIQNVYSGCCLGTSGGIADGTDAKVYSKALEYPLRLYQLWKVKHIGNGHYSVRPMNKMDMLLDVTGTNVDIWKSSAADTYAGLASNLRWKISYTAGGYIFQNDGSVSKTMQCASGAGATVSVATYNGTTPFCWTLEKVESPLPGAVLYQNNETTYTGPTLYIAPGESRTLSNMGLHAVGYSTSGMTESFTWSSNSAGVTVNSATGEVTGVSPGTVQITGNCAYGYVYYYLVVLPIANGTYLVRNKESGLYIDIENQNMINGTNLHQWSFHAGTSQRWIITHQGTGTYTFQSANSSSAYFMGVSGDSTASEQAVVLRDSNGGNGTQWKIEASTSGAYKLIPLTGEENNLVLALDVGVFTPIDANGVTLHQYEYSDNADQEDEWELDLIVASTVSREKQENTLWCWAASARMYSRSYYPEITATQENAVVAIKGSTENVTGNMDETVSAVNYYVGTVTTTSLGTKHTEQNMIFSKQALINFINNGDVVILRRGYYPIVQSPTGREGGHATLLFGYVIIDGDVLFLIHDPDIYAGETYQCSYEKICNGQSSTGIGPYDLYIWDGAIAINNFYFSNQVATEFPEE